MQAAFIDIGMERAAFLHVEDLIRPDDFEAYLDKDGFREVDPVHRDAAEAGAKPESDAGSDAGDDEDDVAQESATTVEASESESDKADDDDADDDDDEDSSSDASAAEIPSSDEAAASEPDNDSNAEGEIPDLSEDLEPADESDDEPAEDSADQQPEQPDQAAEPQPKVAIAPSPIDNRNGRRRRRGRNGRGRDKREPPRAPVNANTAPRPAGRLSMRDRRNRGPAARSARAVPITDVVREGDEVIVQVSKEPIGTKGARVTSHVALAGRHVVYLPTVDHIGISKRIGSTRERQRLRQVIESLKPEAGGLIVRTVAEGLTKKDLKTDIGYLIALWKEVSRLKQGAKAPNVLYTELDLVLKTARDLFTDDVERIIIDDREQHARLVRFVEMFLPSRVQDIELYTGDEPIFDAYGIEDEIGRALGRKVPLSSGGYLVIDQAEALTAIDVNTGRYVGKGSKDLEETALKTNLEAVAEIAYQLRLRNIGGLVILDLIDMDQSSNREAVWRSLEQALAKDKAKTTINRISELGLIEMTRKRTRESLTRMLHEPCFYCDGTGQIQSRTTVAYEILRQIRRERHNLKGYSVVVNAHPAVIDLLQTEEKLSVQEAERRYMRRIELVARREYHLEQFDLQGR
jgi:ribonuclease G